MAFALVVMKTNRGWPAGVKSVPIEDGEFALPDGFSPNTDSQDRIWEIYLRRTGEAENPNAPFYFWKSFNYMGDYIFAYPDDKEECARRGRMFNFNTKTHRRIAQYNDGDLDLAKPYRDESKKKGFFRSLFG